MWIRTCLDRFISVAGETKLNLCVLEGLESATSVKPVKIANFS